jgi:hypothetical protein
VPRPRDTGTGHVVPRTRRRLGQSRSAAAGPTAGPSPVAGRPARPGPGGFSKSESSAGVWADESVLSRPSPSLRLSPRVGGPGPELSAGYRLTGFPQATCRHPPATSGGDSHGSRSHGSESEGPGRRRVLTGRLKNSMMPRLRLIARAVPCRHCQDTSKESGSRRRAASGPGPPPGRASDSLTPAAVVAAAGVSPPIHDSLQAGARQHWQQSKRPPAGPSCWPLSTAAMPCSDINRDHHMIVRNRGLGPAPSREFAKKNRRFVPALGGEGGHKVFWAKDYCK